MRALAWSFFILLFATAWCQQDIAQYDVVWTSLSADSRGSMPIGNGDIALNVWTRTDGLYMYIAKSDAYDENSRLLKVGKVKIVIEGNPFTSKDFMQQTKITEGALKIQGGGVSVDVWVDANNPVVNIDIYTTMNTSLSYMVESIVWRTIRRTLSSDEANSAHGICFDAIETPDIIVPSTSDSSVVWYHQNSKTTQQTAWQESINMQQNGNFKGEDPLLSRIFGCHMSATHSKLQNQTTLIGQGSRVYNISIVVFTDPQASSSQSWIDQITKMAQQMDLANDTAKAASKNQHQAWWSSFWDASYVIMNGSSTTFQIGQIYTLQRWMDACGGGRGTFPIKFNGLLFTTDYFVNNIYTYSADFRMWGGGYWFQNTRFPYWAMLMNGDYDMMMPLFSMYVDMLPLVQARTDSWFAHDGAFFSETLWPWGTYLDADYGCEMNKRPKWSVDNQWMRYHINGGLELIAMMLAYYDHTRDDNFLQKYILPMAEAQLTFFDQHYNVDLNGQKVLTPAQSIETWQEAINPLPDIAGLHFIIPKLLSLPSIPTPLQTWWTSLLNQLPSVPQATNSSGQAYLTPAGSWLTNSLHNSENPELYAVFPFPLYTILNNSTNDYNTALNAYERRLFKCDQGWCQDLLVAALLGITNDAQQLLLSRLKYPLGQGYRFPTFYNHFFDFIPEEDHGAVAQLGIQYMLMQTSGRQIVLFPSWPSGWDVRFRLHAPLQTTVEATCQGGKIVHLDVQPPARKQDVQIRNGASCTL